MTLFSNMFNNQNQSDPRQMALQMAENMYRSGKINIQTYDMLRSTNDPKEFANILLRSNVATNDQINLARNNVSSFFGSK